MAKNERVHRGVYVPHKRHALVCGDGRTRQEFAAECDINGIMKRYEKTGVVTHYNRSQPQYLDYSDVPDYHSAMNFMIDAQASFMRLPARVRAEFGNDAARFVDYAGDPKNIDKMREWGLAPAAPPPTEPTEVRIVDGPAPGADRQKPPGAAPSPKSGAGDGGAS